MKTRTKAIEGSRLLSYTECAVALGVSESTISRLVTSGKLASIRAGARSVKIAPDALERFVRQGDITTGATRKARKLEA